MRGGSYPADATAKSGGNVEFCFNKHLYGFQFLFTKKVILREELREDGLQLFDLL